jgi:hypothetical protein
MKNFLFYFAIFLSLFRRPNLQMSEAWQESKLVEYEQADRKNMGLL